MKITESQLKKMICEEAQSILKESDYKIAAVDYSGLSPSQDLRFGRGIASTSTLKQDDFPHWSHIEKALNIIFEDLSILHNSSKTFQLDQELLNLIYIIRTFIKKNPQIELREVEYRFAEDLLKSTMNIAEYILEKTPESVQQYKPEIFDKIMKLAEFVRQVAGARWGSMSVGYPLSSVENIEVPDELK